MGGRYIVSLVVAHALLIIWGYAVTAHTSVTSETATLLTQYPDVLMATVAGFLLLGVGIVSMRAARRRLRYETWYYLHLYTYLAIALAFSHQFADGAAFVTDLAARFWWSAMYLTVGRCCLWYRVAVPLRASARHRFAVVGVKPEAPGVVSVYIGGTQLDELDAEPGQFFRWRFLTRSLWWSSHPFSLSAAPGPDLLRITVKDLGDHSQALAGCGPGPGSSPKALTARSPPPPVRAAACCCWPAGSASPRCGPCSRRCPGTSPWSTAPAASRTSCSARSSTRSRPRAAPTVHYVVGSRAEIGGDPLSPGCCARWCPAWTEQDAYVCGPAGMASAAVAALRAGRGAPRQHSR